MTADGTVEWGDDTSPRLIDRVLADPEPSGPALNLPAIAAAALAVVLLATAEFQPWGTITGNADAVREARPGGADLTLSELGGTELIPYYVGWMGMLALVGLAFVVGPAARRVVLGAGTGWAVGLSVLVLGIGRRMATLPFGDDPLLDSAPAAGVWFAGAAVLAASIALLLTAWRPGMRWPVRRGGTPKPEPVEDTGPADLTVTPLS
jgi:hypothetical protein